MPYRITNERGETLAETLVALLIAAVSLVMFLNMVSGAAQTIKTGRTWNADVNKSHTFLSTKSGDSARSGDKIETGTISIKAGSVTLAEGTVKCFVAYYNGKPDEGEKPVISYVYTG